MAFWENWCKDDDCDCSWTKVIIWALVVAVVGGLIAVLVIAFAVVYPPKATADDAVLQRFALAPGNPAANSNISYNVTATLSLKNPNIYRVISYGPLAVAFSFNGTRFDESATVPAFDNKARKTATLHVTVGGVAKPVKLSAEGVKEFSAENATGKFDVEVRLDTVLQYKGRKAKCPLVVICPLKLQLVDPNVAATAFQRNKCTILRAKMSGC
ncbi:NDR1/HIN1-like protein 3 [Phragmites australis]|uniref:NDR1/HIN1-like protein 3 n=1 Tax=Phragmites australis TaxID=29695 RepID=UPI002D76F4F0|nr:NDR1/HIN1-like protein 3 [Phragmites australis]